MKGNRPGQIAYVGEVHFKPEEVMVGVVLDEVSRGKNLLVQVKKPLVNL